MMELTHPRLFTPLTATKLLPSRLGIENHRKLTRLAMKPMKAPCCSVSGLPLPPTGEGVALEFRSSPASKATKVNPKDLRVVDEWVFWSRHVELALSEEKGRIIFMPWMSQGQLLDLVRMLHMGRQVAIENGWAMTKETADHHIEKLNQLGDDSLMINALGLPNELKTWEAEEWLLAIRDLPARDRKTYMQRFGQHVRYLPTVETSDTQTSQVIKSWRKAYNLDGAHEEGILSASEKVYTDIMTKLKLYERNQAQRNAKMAKPNSPA